MKTAILTSLLIACFSITNVFAQNTEKKVLTNIEPTETGSKKEVVFLNEESFKAEKKVTYHYDLDNNLLQKIDYNWDAYIGWVPTQKYEYEYNFTGKVSLVTFTKWNDKKSKWANDKSKYTALIYDEQGVLMAVN